MNWPLYAVCHLVARERQRQVRGERRRRRDQICARQEPYDSGTRASSNSLCTARSGGEVSSGYSGPQARGDRTHQRTDQPVPHCPAGPDTPAEANSSPESNRTLTEQRKRKLGESSLTLAVVRMKLRCDGSAESARTSAGAHDGAARCSNRLHRVRHPRGAGGQ